MISAAFALDSEKVGPVVDAPQGFFVFHVAEKLPAHVPDLLTIRERVEAALRKERSEALARTKAEALLAEAQKTDLDTAAKAADAKIDETDPFARQGDYIPKIGSVPDLKKVVFQLTAEKPVAPAVYTVSGSSVVAVLKERIPADEEKFKTEKDNLMKQAEERHKQQTMEEFVNYLKARASVELSQDFLASVPDSGPLDGSPRRRR